MPRFTEVTLVQQTSADYLHNVLGWDVVYAYNEESWACFGTRDAVRVSIKDFLWNDEIGLPAPAYTEDDVNVKTDEVFRHVYHVYPTVPSPYYPE